MEKYRNETDDTEESKTIFRKNIEKYLDAGYGQCYLKVAEVAQMVSDSLRFFDGSKYRLSAWVVMPNHIHFLVIPFEGVQVRDIAHSIKSYTAHEANKILGRTGQFWQPEPFDRYIRNADHFANVVRYIENNPVKAGLCKTLGDWRFSSAFGKSESTDE